MIRVSVVVPTCHRPDLLGRLLDALDAQDFDPACSEVIVADDAASDATRRQVEERSARSRAVVRYARVTEPHGPAAARNVGWRAARGEIVAFTDDDCVPDPHWLTAGVSSFAEGVVAASGRVVVPLSREPTDYERDAAGLEGAEFVTANCFCRRDALAAVGGFDERFEAAWREDSDLHFALLQRGGWLVQAPGAVVVHPVRPAPWGVSLRQQRKCLYDALLYKKHPESYRRRIRRGPPWDYYAIVAAIGAGTASLAVGRPWLATAAWALWAGLTLRFCARRLRRTSWLPGHVTEMVATSVLIPPLSVAWRLYGAWKFRVLFL